MQKRCFDIIFALIVSVFAIAPVVVIWLIVASTSQGFGHLLVAARWTAGSVFYDAKISQYADRYARGRHRQAVERPTPILRRLGHFCVAPASMNYRKFTQFCAVI